MINIQHLNFQYRKQDALFTDLSFQQENGSIVGLLGKNGAGKSTFLKLISGLLKPQLGELRINSFKPFDRLPDFLADIYMVSEEFLFPSITIGLYIKATAPLYPKFDYDKMDKILKEFELNLKSNLNGLSHGQRKKFLIAFALSTNCSLLILDEPTNGLDIPSKSLFRKVLVSSVTEEQLVLISTHQVKDIETIIDKIVVLDEGKIVFNETVFDISQQWQFKTVNSLSGIETPIYQEKCLGGHRILMGADELEETEIDIELLFNAIINKVTLKSESHVI
ncbi:ABC transporter ATP-binding protein [Flavobacterium gilvum]|uniref:ABC transporter ATP-binding protein n=1 Tax=Flavobacterium gilvum TaxID=1492737 RepID=A0AAC9I0V2_9FLAO|nr:ABC transporter ATP-binding protein [Flavobacterium gilvum]AOW08064.1 ABC transporter ATP-binding protein [Flavobacterium gilvum]KFC57741.1 ABC transporter ATP-binding protein [Flavobacterium gilvum]